MTLDTRADESRRLQLAVGETVSRMKWFESRVPKPFNSSYGVYFDRQSPHLYYSRYQGLKVIYGRSWDAYFIDLKSVYWIFASISFTVITRLVPLRKLSTNGVHLKAFFLFSKEWIFSQRRASLRWIICVWQDHNDDGNSKLKATDYIHQAEHCNNKLFR